MMIIQEPGFEPGDIIIVLDEKQHPVSITFLWYYKGEIDVSSNTARTKTLMHISNYDEILSIPIIFLRKDIYLKDIIFLMKAN